MAAVASTMPATMPPASSTPSSSKATKASMGGKGGKGSSKKFEHNFNQTSQYSEDTIQQFEKTMGKNYMSAGGHETSLETARLLAPVLSRTKSPVVLDVGCGIGGAAFFFAAEHNATVHAVDINPVGIEMAQRELEANPLPRGKVHFSVVDAAAEGALDSFGAETFDVIHSRDTILHLTHDQKKVLFERFHSWLKPGGMIIVCDYCLGPKSASEGVSEDFQKYMDTRGYHLLSPEGWESLLEGAGFEQDAVNARDKQLWYCRMARKECDRVLLPGPSREIFLQTKTEEDLKKLARVYDDKITMTLRGDRSYVMVTATKKAPHHALRKEVVDAYRWCSDHGYIMSCDGNVSVRGPTSGTDRGDTFFITPSGVEIPNLQPSMVVECHTGNGKPLIGEEYKPSSESRLHDHIYRTRPDVGAILHTHSVYACALACCRLPLPPAHYAVCELLQEFDFSDASGGTTAAAKTPSMEDAAVRCAPYHTYGSLPLAEATSKALGKHHAVLMANHGAIVVGENMEMARYNTQRLERECEIYWKCLQLHMVGPPKPLTLGEIEDMQKKDQTYGQDHKDVEDNDNNDNVEDTPSMDEPTPSIEPVSSESDNSSVESSSSSTSSSSPTMEKP